MLVDKDKDCVNEAVGDAVTDDVTSFESVPRVLVGDAPSNDGVGGPIVGLPVAVKLVEDDMVWDAESFRSESENVGDREVEDDNAEWDSTLDFEFLIVEERDVVAVGADKDTVPDSSRERDALNVVVEDVDRDGVTVVEADGSTDGEGERDCVFDGSDDELLVDGIRYV